jgi:hypothetical protein
MPWRQHVLPSGQHFLIYPKASAFDLYNTHKMARSEMMAKFENELKEFKATQSGK